ncbi:hypothetical protein LIER_33750 [Lithospermum erythrorhizon]|uniref:DNA-3-methyladenine glycosylase I n=1 Tax=Lithospermum erythrorhizon TaxID=34254 RepID=A0AAV3S1M9_LITER
MNSSDSEARPVFAPAGNKSISLHQPQKPNSKSKLNNSDSLTSPNSNSKLNLNIKSDSLTSPNYDRSPPALSTPYLKKSTPVLRKSFSSISRHQEARAVLMRSNLSMNSSCSSDSLHEPLTSPTCANPPALSTTESRKSTPVLRKSMSSISRVQEARVALMRSNLSMSASCSSSDSLQSRGSTGRISQRSLRNSQRKSTQCGGSRGQKSVENNVEEKGVIWGDKKRCGWVTSNTDPIYAAFHDEEWGVPVHDDKKLFELLSLCSALAELTWPVILNRRHLFREVFQDFDPVAISKLNDKKIATAGSPASALLSELKLRAIIENARQTCKIISELGSFDKYIWGFVNYKPIVGHFRYPRQVPIKTSKADAISKDLVRRGFRGIGPTVVYSFMQVAGIANDHLIGCFRFHDCIAANDATDKDDSLLLNKTDGKQAENAADLGLAREIDDLNLC